MKPWLSEAPVFLLCLLPERKNSLLYGLSQVLCFLVSCGCSNFFLILQSSLIYTLLFCKVPGKGWIGHLKLLHSALLLRKSMTNIWRMCFLRSMQRFHILRSTVKSDVTMLLDFQLTWQRWTLFIILVAWWAEFEVVNRDLPRYSFGLKGSYTYSWDVCLPSLSWAVWCFIYCCGDSCFNQFHLLV